MGLVKVVAPHDRRVLHYGDKGKDVLAYQRMLTRELYKLGYYPTNRQGGLYGKGTLRDTLRLQHVKKIEASGRVGALTWTAVDPQMRLADRLLLALPKPKPAPMGVRLVHELRVMLAFGMPIYTQMRLAAKTLTVWRRIGSDCSASALLAKADAEGRAYSGSGNTQWIWDNFPVVTEAEVVIGTAILYGDGRTTDHINIVSDVSKRLCIGFGFAPGGEYAWTNHHSPIMGFRRIV